MNLKFQISINNHFSEVHHAEAIYHELMIPTILMSLYFQAKFL